MQLRASKKGPEMYPTFFGISTLTYKDVGNATMISGVSLARGGQMFWQSPQGCA